MQRITSKDNNIVKHISKLIKSSSYRKENSEFVIEGVRLCCDAVDSGVKIKTAVFSQVLTKIQLFFEFITGQRVRQCH